MKVSDTVLGALIALASAMLTQLFNLFADRLKAGREQKHLRRQRELSLKRDIYLPLVHAFTESLSLFIAIPSTHHSKIVELRLSQAAQNALAEKDLIANDSVMAAVQVAAKQFSQGIARLMLLKMDEVKLAIDLDYLTKRIDDLNSANRLLVDRMRALREAGTLSPETAVMLDSQFQLTQPELKSLLSDQKDKIAQRAVLLKQLHLQMMKEVSDLSAASAHAVVEIRRDLDISTNAEAIIAQYQEAQGFIGKSVPAFIEEAWNKVTPKTNVAHKSDE